MRKTIYDKIWQQHVIHEAENEPAILYIDTHLIHEVTSPQAFSGLKNRGLKLHRSDRTFATMDHSIPTRNQDQKPWTSIKGQEQVETLIKNCQEFGVKLEGLNSPYQGIIHVFGPEIGEVRPGYTLVAGDSHTATHGAFGVLAFGIGTTEVEHVFATQCILQKKMPQMVINIDGQLNKGVSAKDVILYIINTIGVDGATGYAVEYRGKAITNMNMSERMTVCNMTIEAGGRVGIISPDQKTVDYLLEHINFANQEEKQQTIKKWLEFATDQDAQFDKVINIEAGKIEPMITYGTNPGMSIGISQVIPEPKNKDEEKALEYMGFKVGEKMIGKKIDYVFIGSCTNGRIEDLRVAAEILKGKKISDKVEVWVVPGSMQVKFKAEEEGLDKIFIQAGCQWRMPGCSACLAMNADDVIPAGKYCASTSNRNFVGRQGKGARTLLMSPVMAAGVAIFGEIFDVSKLVK